MASELSLTVCEHAIKQVKSVIAARIKMDNNENIAEVHVLAGPGRNPKQVVRDVESVLTAQFGLQIDHKKISVAQVEEEEDGPDATPDTLRPKLIGVTLRTVNLLAVAQVELGVGEQVVQGTVQGSASSYNKLRLCADATLKALENLTIKGCTFVTEDVAITTLARHQVAQIAVTMVTPGREQSLVGCAMVRSDDREAVVKATLDAVNRKLRFMQSS